MGYTEVSEALLGFIDESPSPFHAVRNIEKLLEGYTKLNEEDKWELIPGEAYYVCRNSSSIIAFRLPKNAPDGFLIGAAHTDCPAFKLKTDPEMGVDDEYVKLNVEKYGGMLMSTWFDRPLSIAGRVVVKNGNKLETKLVDLKKGCAIIPNLAIHMNRQANDGYSYNAQKDMLPLVGSKKGRIAEEIAKAAGVEKENVISGDLFLYNSMKGCFTGIDGEYVSSRALDDLMCAWAMTEGLKNSQPAGNKVAMAAIFDNEEVGSTTKQGADSSFLSDVISRIADAYAMNGEALKRAYANSFMVSADNGHALHPNYAETSNPKVHPVMNGGVVIKYNANQKYTTDAVSDAVFRTVCEKAGVPCQSYHNRSDIAGGSTLGNISGSHVSIPTVDIGLAQLAMHSSYETAGAKDAEYLLLAIEGFFGSDIKVSGGTVTVE